MSESPVNVLSDIFFSPLSIKILVKMIGLVLEKKPLGVYNLGSHNGMSKADFNFTFIEYLNLSTKTMKRIAISEADFFRAYRPRNMCMDISKFESTLDVKLPLLNDLIKQVAQEYDTIT